MTKFETNYEVLEGFNKSNGPDYLSATKIEGKEIIRILPDTRLNGLFFFKFRQYYFKHGISSKYITSGCVFGELDEIEDELTVIRNAPENNIAELNHIEDKANRYTFTGAEKYIIPCIRLKHDSDKKLVPRFPEQATILTCPEKLVKKINEIIIDPDYRDPAVPAGIQDRERGFNLTISVTKTGNKYDYSVKAGRQEYSLADKMFDCFYEDIPDVKAQVRAKIDNQPSPRTVLWEHLKAVKSAGQPNHPPANNGFDDSEAPY